jgi:hypothetical protein
MRGQRLAGALFGLAASLALAAGASAQDDNPSTPGQIANPGSYQGSMALQQQEQQSSAAQSQANQAMQGRLDATYRAYAPNGAGGAARAGPPPVNWWAKPPLPASRNPLLGRWRQVVSQGYNAGDVGGGATSLMIPGTAEAAAGILSGATAEACKSIFGTGVVAFEPDSLQWVAPDGHEEILNHIAYRASGSDVVVLSHDPGAIDSLFFGFPDHDGAVVAFFKCTMRRLGSGSAPSAGGGTAASGGRSAHALVAAPHDETGQRMLPLTDAPPPSGAASATLKFAIEFDGPGTSAPIAGAHFWLTPEDPAKALASVGAGGGGAAAQLASDCGQQTTCKRDFAALTAQAVASVDTDAGGHAQTAALPQGRYYALGVVNYQGKHLYWLRGVNLVAGANGLTLDQDDGGALP